MDRDMESYSLGARFKPGGKLYGDIKIGLGKAAFKNMADKNHNYLIKGKLWDGTYMDSEDFVAGASVGYQMSEKTLLNLNLERSYKGTTDENQRDGRIFINTALRLGLTQELGDRLSADAGVTWQNQDWVEVPVGEPLKEYDRFGFTAGLTYEIKDWLTAGAQYGFNDMQSKSAEYADGEFDSNTFTFSVSAQF